jgi:hypothetical protein
MASVTHQNSTKPEIPAVKGTNTAVKAAGASPPFMCVGVEGDSATGWGVWGHSKSGRGVVAMSDTDYGLRAHSGTSAGLKASSDTGRGVEGWSKVTEGVVGISDSGNAVWGQTEGGGAGVLGTSKNGIGVLGDSINNEGVRGVSHSLHGAVVGIQNCPSPGGAAGWFESSNGEGVHGVSRGAFAAVAGIQDSPVPGVTAGWFESSKGEGVRGTAKTSSASGVVGVNTGGGNGVFGTSDNGIGVWGNSLNHEGVHASTKSTTHAAMAAFQDNAASDTPALFVRHDGYLAGNRTAAVFKGNVFVEGDITLTNADCAEDFDISADSSTEPGTVMVLDDESNLRESFHPYDKRVAGVISGAGNFKPGLVLDKHPSPGIRKPIALLGKVFCKVDAQFGPIAVGDLLTTSPTAGHAMRVDDPHKAFGAIIGKALRPQTGGQGLIPILIALR